MIIRNKIRTVVLCVLTLLCLTGCVQKQVSYKTEDYILQTEYKEDFRILQLTDIHLSTKDNRQRQFDFMDLTVQDAEPDMIVLSGDLFTFADKQTARDLFAWVDSYGIPWTVTFGNHDEQCYFSVDWLTSLLNNYGSNCIFLDLQDDDVFGNANFAINLTDGDNLVAQVIIMDSNRYYYGEYFGYDYIKQDQIDWYERLVNDTTAQNGSVVPSLLVFHIPLPEYADAWEAVQNGNAVLEYGSNNEAVCPPEYNSGFFDKIVELGSTVGISVGHDHLNNSRILYKGVHLSYGVNATDRIYFDENILGGEVIVIHRNGCLDYEAYYHHYEELD